MQCPKCSNTLNEIQEKDFSALKCQGCHGIWFRDGSHEIAKTIKGAASIDDDKTNSAAAYNEMRNINCPECEQAMLQMVDRAQFHIEFEACPYCYGVFFDAGEFKDYTEFTFMERVKQAIDTLKTNLSH